MIIDVVSGNLLSKEKNLFIIRSYREYNVVYKYSFNNMNSILNLDKASCVIRHILFIMSSSTYDLRMLYTYIYCRVNKINYIISRLHSFVFSRNLSCTCSIQSRGFSYFSKWSNTSNF